MNKKLYLGCGSKAEVDTGQDEEQVSVLAENSAPVTVLKQDSLLFDRKNYYLIKIANALSTLTDNDN